MTEGSNVPFMKALTDLEKKVLDGYLLDDSGRGDATGIMFEEDTSTAIIISEENCKISGIEAAEHIFRKVGCSVKFPDGISSGAYVKEGTEIIEITGPTSGIMRGERVALNILSRMSGIATISGKASDIADKASPGTRVAGTRKTTPGFSIFEKRALMDGGALPHRMDLSSLAMLKDNHLNALGGGPDAVIAGVKMLKESFGPYIKIEVEIEEIPSGLAAVNAGADIIMLDNFSPESVAIASAEIIKAADEQGKDIILEASGGIGLDEISGYAPHVDVISMGSLTYNAPYIGFKLDI